MITKRDQSCEVCTCVLKHQNEWQTWEKSPKGVHYWCRVTKHDYAWQSVTMRENVKDASKYYLALNNINKGWRQVPKRDTAARIQYCNYLGFVLSGTPCVIFRKIRVVIDNACHMSYQWYLQRINKSTNWRNYSVQAKTSIWCYLLFGTQAVLSNRYIDTVSSS
jgi:hypothetical protein